MVSLKMGPILFWLLLIGIIMETISYTLLKNYDSTFKMYCYFFIILFTFYLLYDTKKLYVNANLCKEVEGADYVKESMGIFLDILNLFARITGLKRRQ